MRTVCTRCEWVGDELVSSCPTCNGTESLQTYRARLARCVVCNELLAPAELYVCRPCVLDGACE